MVLLDMTVLAVAEPDLARSLRTSTAGLQWATTAYTVTLAALLLSAGAATDRYGPPRLFRAGIAAFTASSLLSAIAPALWVLIVLRAVMGVAAAACVPASMALIAALYPDAAARARAIATWAATSGAAVAAGPVAGGLLIDIAGWRTVFLINVPIGVLVLALTRATRTDRSGHAATRARPAAAHIDWRSHLAAAAVLALTTDALIAAGSRQRLHTVVAAGAAVAALCVFVSLERRSTAPVLDRALLGARSVRASLLAGATVNFALSGVLFVLPLYLERAHHLTPLQTGLVLLPLTIPFAVNPPLTGRIVARVGPGRPVVAGLALIAAGTAASAAATWADAGPVGLRLAFGLFITGLGVSFALPALTAAVVAAAPPGTTGAAAGLLQAVRQAGATAGVAVMGAAVAAGTAWSLLVSCAVSGVALAVFGRSVR